MQTLMIGNLAIDDRGVDRLARLLRRYSYFWAFVSFVIVARWIKIRRADIPLFDVAWEGNLWTWSNVAFMVLAGAALFTTAMVRRANRAPWAGWMLAAAALFALSLDDATSIHESFDSVGLAMGGGTGLFHFAWVLPGLVAGAVVIAVLWGAMRSADRVVRRDFALGVALFFGGALLLEMLGGAVLSSAGHRRPYTILYHVEEILEAVGIVFILSAALKDLIRQGGTGPAPVPGDSDPPARRESADI